ncbi:hypothetical protein B0H13DRAFT_1995714 [Mycena leptocephala]|nr:hypothetical protein B0H13DRAFT_1995714 [Mycena leptocephala]
MSPTTYSAWYAIQKGLPATALQLKTGIPIPTKLPKGQVLVKVQAIALNPFIYKMMAGLPNFAAGRPHVVERDLAGVIVNPNGTEFVVGDKVFGTTTSKIGTMAEYVVMPSSSLVLQPPNVTPVEAAGLGIVVLTAHQALKNLKVKAGDTVFINGGSSAVGLSAIQIAKSMGCTVVATASARNKETLLRLGVDEFIDYTSSPLVSQLLARAGSTSRSSSKSVSKQATPQFSAIFDAVGLPDATLYLACPQFLSPGGAFVSAGGFPSTRKALGGMLRLIFEGMLRPAVFGGVRRKFEIVTCPLGKQDLEEVRALVAKGAVKPIVDSVHVFDRTGVMNAYDRLMTNHAVGKVVVALDAEAE